MISYASPQVGPGEHAVIIMVHVTMFDEAPSAAGAAKGIADGLADQLRKMKDHRVQVRPMGGPPLIVGAADA